MKICRYNDDRLGIVIDGAIHDVTSAQNEIRAAHPYASKSDAIVAALSDWRARLEEIAAHAKPISVDSVKLLPPIARPGKLMAAPVNYKAHIDEAQADWRGSFSHSLIYVILLVHIIKNTSNIGAHHRN